VRMMFQHDPEVTEWIFGLMNDPEYFEQYRYIDTIAQYQSIIADSQKEYDQTPLQDQHTRHKLRYVLREAKKDLAVIRAEYRIFQKYQQRTSISK
jgi:hypothetical protein